MADVLDRIKALIARSESSELEEARTSAYLACKLIRENKVELRIPTAKHEQEVSLGEEIWDSFFNNAKKRRTTGFCDLCLEHHSQDKCPARSFTCTSCKTRKPKQERSADTNLCNSCYSEHQRQKIQEEQQRLYEEKQRKRAASSRRQEGDKWKLTIVNFAGVCITCKKMIDVGTKAYWLKGTGIRHLKCEP